MRVATFSSSRSCELASSFTGNSGLTISLFRLGPFDKLPRPDFQCLHIKFEFCFRVRWQKGHFYFDSDGKTQTKELQKHPALLLTESAVTSHDDCGKLQ